MIAGPRGPGGDRGSCASRRKARPAQRPWDKRLHPGALRLRDGPSATAARIFAAEGAAAVMAVTVFSFAARRAIARCEGPLPLLERVLPAGRRAARRERGFEIVEHDRAVVAVEPRHAVALTHKVERVVPLPARLPLLRHDAEAVARRASR